jgi:hypothetical protein
MLTRLFSHSKPIAFVILSILFAVAFFIENFISTTIDIKASVIFQKLGLLAVLFLILFLLNFIVKRNRIQKTHSYTVSSFVFLIIAFPEVLRSTDFLLAYLFLILSFRRIVSLKTNTNIKQKIFDSSFLLSISIWFEPFHWFFLLVIYFCVIMYASQNFRHFLIPLVGLAVGFVIHFCYFLIFEDKWVDFSRYSFEFNGIDPFFDTFKYGNLLGLLMLIFIWIIFKLPLIYSKAKLHVGESLSVVLCFLLVSIVVILFNNSPLSKDAIYLIWPLSILIGNYFQLKSTKTWTKEVFYILFIAGIAFSAIY